MNNLQSAYPKILLCDCHHKEHLLSVDYDKQTNSVEIGLKLNQYLPWYKRIWIAIKYVFGWKATATDWDDFVLSKTAADEILYVLSDYYDGLENDPSTISLENLKLKTLRRRAEEFN